MAIAGDTVFDKARTIFQSRFDEIVNSWPDDPIDELVYEEEFGDQLFIEDDTTHSFPAVQEWLGARQISDLRASQRIIEKTTLQEAISYDRKKAQADTNGRRFRNHADQLFARAARWKHEKLIGELLAGNLTTYTGENLLANSHSFSNSGGDNLVTDQLNAGTLQTAISGMKLHTDEAGVPWPVTPTHLLVGPLLEETALLITGSSRVVAVNTTGDVNVASGVGAGTVDQVEPVGRLRVIVSPYISDDSWFTLDASRPVTALGWATGGPLVQAMLEQPDQHHVFMNDELIAGVYQDCKWFGGLWQFIWGAINPS